MRGKIICEERRSRGESGESGPVSRSAGFEGDYDLGRVCVMRRWRRDEDGGKGRDRSGQRDVGGKRRELGRVVDGSAGSGLEGWRGLGAGNGPAWNFIVLGERKRGEGRTVGEPDSCVSEGILGSADDDGTLQPARA